MGCVVCAGDGRLDVGSGRVFDAGDATAGTAGGGGAGGDGGRTLLSPPFAGGSRGRD